VRWHGTHTAFMKQLVSFLHLWYDMAAGNRTWDLPQSKVSKSITVHTDKYSLCFQTYRHIINCFCDTPPTS